ncbi:MAG TPA: RodZ domain-containing protein [Xanthomonadaceae bacterium]|nr:RodZ domain-containing protein [Xanthomonadaceae bacterium]
MISPSNSTPGMDRLSDAERGCGERLRDARLKAGLRQEDVAARLKMPLRVVQSLEAEDWSCLGAPVFVRGQLRSYGRLLGLTTAPMLAVSGVASVEPTRLFSRSYVPQSQHMLEHATRRLVYVVLTAALVLPVWLATRSGAPVQPDAPTVPLDAPAASIPAAGDTTGAISRQPPMVASLAPLPASPAVPPVLALHFMQDSWLQANAADGRVLEQGVVIAGQRRQFAAGQVSRIVLGNAQGVEVRLSTTDVDLAPYQRANVARFTVSSDGSLATAPH